MAQLRLSMRKILEILRLKFDGGYSHRDIAKSLHIARGTLRHYLNRFERSGLSWPLSGEWTQEALEARLFPAPAEPAQKRPLPDFVHIHEELKRFKRLNLTLFQLWEEYKDQHPAEGFQYSRFCGLYRKWQKKQDYCLRQEHRGGEKVFIDYGDGLYLVNPDTGELILTQLFVAVWGASNFTFAEASLSQDLPNWVGSHGRAFDYFGCVPHLLVPDNLKSGVSKACRYEPDINPTYADMVRHYDTAVLPARPRKPRDKAKAEAGVLIAKRWILSVLRHRVFHSLPDMNAAIAELLEKLNNKPLQKRKQSRRELFALWDKPNAQVLPKQAYQYAEWKGARVNVDYHIEVDGHWYSVPFHLLGQKVDVRLTATTLEALHKGQRVAAHVRSRAVGAHTTTPDHMPPAHRKYTEWSPSRFIHWAEKTGPSTASLIKKVLESRKHPEQAYRSCLGILRLEKTHGPHRLETAAERAIRFRALSFRAVKSILDKGMDLLDPTPPNPSTGALTAHDNIRGAHFFQ